MDPSRHAPPCPKLHGVHHHGNLGPATTHPPNHLPTYFFGDRYTRIWVPTQIGVGGRVGHRW